jgi:hypothetical protein
MLGDRYHRQIRAPLAPRIDWNGYLQDETAMEQLGNVYPAFLYTAP